MVAALQEREITYVRCKTFGHAWDDISGTAESLHHVQYLLGERIMLRCIRCATTREDIFSRAHGGLIARQYDYPDDYKTAGKLTRSEFRLFYFQHPGVA